MKALWAVQGALPGRLTLGLYNCYDPKQWHDIMRITLARAGPVAAAFDCDLAAFGFPFEQARRRGAKQSEAGLRRPADVADFVASTTSIGEGGEALVGLANEGRFSIHPFPADGFPAKLGKTILTTPTPAAGKATTPLDVARHLGAGHAELLVFGLGPRGLPADLLAAAPLHLELTGRGISMETATALGALPALVFAHLQHVAPSAPAVRPTGPHTASFSASHTASPSNSGSAALLPGDEGG